MDWLVHRAFTGNLTIRIAQAKVGEAEAQESFTDALDYVSGSIQMIFGGPTPEARTTVRNDLATVTADSLNDDFSFGELGVSFRGRGELIQPLYTFGQTTAAQDAAASATRAARHNVTITEAEAVQRIVEAYWAHILAKGYRSSLEEGQDVLQDVLEKVEDLLDADSPQVTESDRLRLTHALATLRVRLEASRSAAALTKKALRLLVGLDPTTPFEITHAEIDEIPEAVAGVESLLSGAIEHRPELAALRAIGDAQESLVDFHYRSLAPQLFVGGFVEFAITTNATDQTNPFIYDPFNFVSAGIGVGIRWDLDVFKKLASADIAQAQAATRRVELAAAAQAVDLDVRAAHADLSGSYIQIPLLKKAERAGRSWLSASVLAYDVGAGDAGELIDAFISRATAEGELKQTFYSIHVGWTKLQKASGTLVARYRQ